MTDTEPIAEPVAADTLVAAAGWQLHETRPYILDRSQGQLSFGIHFVPSAADARCHQLDEGARRQAGERIAAHAKPDYLCSEQHRRYTDLRSKLAECGRDFERLENSIKRAEADRSDALLNSKLSGEKLAAKLSKLDAQVNEARQRLADAARGKELIAEALEKADAADETELARQTARALTPVHTNAMQTVADILARLAERNSADVAKLVLELQVLDFVRVAGVQRQAVAGLRDEPATAETLDAPAEAEAVDAPAPVVEAVEPAPVAEPAAEAEAVAAV